MGGVTRDMNIPENYEKLGKAGFTPKGAWSATETYNRLDVVYYKGSSYIVVNNGVTGVTPSETDQNYIIMAAGQESDEVVTRYDYANDDSFPWRGFKNIDHKGECCMVYQIEDKFLQINYTDANGAIRHAKFTPTSDTPLSSANSETESE